MQESWPGSKAARVTEPPGPDSYRAGCTDFLSGGGGSDKHDSALPRAVERRRHDRHRTPHGAGHIMAPLCIVAAESPRASGPARALMSLIDCRRRTATEAATEARQRRFPTSVPLTTRRVLPPLFIRSRLLTCLAHTSHAVLLSPSHHLRDSRPSLFPHLSLRLPQCSDPATRESACTRSVPVMSV